jgi:glycosyltransferase involved in cell wall biosynthesis
MATVTIVIPLYNGIEYLEECLESIKTQIFSRWTCLIGVNGHGVDGGAVFQQAQAIVNGLEDSRFLVKNLPNVKGAPAAINALVALAETEWIAHIDADDKWEPMKLQCQNRIVEEYPNVDVIGTFCAYFGEWTGGPRIQGGFVPPDEFMKMNPMVHSSILIRKELAFYTDEFVTYDYDCWIRCLMAGKNFFNVPLSLTWHRVYTNSHFNASGTQKPELVREKYFNRKDLV